MGGAMSEPTGCPECGEPLGMVNFKGRRGLAYTHCSNCSWSNYHEELERFATAETARADAAEALVKALEIEIDEIHKPEWTCCACGSQKCHGIEYNTPGEPTDYDMECDVCGSTEVEESAIDALRRVLDEKDRDGS